MDLPRQIAALEAVRRELETALGGDENWRALRRTSASAADADPDRRDRDARLVKALEANPLYLAWANVSQAIDALRAGNSASDADAQTVKRTPDRKLAAVSTLALADAPSSPTEPFAAAVDAKPKAELPPFRIAEPSEAKVSFVRRPASPTAATATAGAEAKAAAGSEAFVPAAGSAEEAEVAIVNAPVRRFLKALSGD